MPGVTIAVRCLARGLLLLISGRPETPLRVLCILAFDTLHMLRHGKPLPMPRVRTLAALLDFGACANAALDNKACCRHEYRRTLRLLEEAGTGLPVYEYRQRLSDLESRRPLPGGDYWQFQEVSLYREAVVRLSLGMAAAIAHGNQALDEGIRAISRDADLNILFRMAMQCQIIDDMLDYSHDVSAGLPSFLTASKPLAQAFELTRLASVGYADLPRTGDFFVLRSALLLVSMFTKLVIVLARLRNALHSNRRMTTPQIAALADATKMPYQAALRE